MPPSIHCTVTAKDCNDINRSGDSPFTSDTKTTLANAVDDLANEMAEHNCPDLAQEYHDIATAIRNS